MNINAIPISTLFIGIHGLIALILSYIVVNERMKTRVWHGESKKDVTMQPDPFVNPTAWVAKVEKMSQKLVASTDEGVLQRKVRAHGNFAEYVPIGLLFLVALELMSSPSWLLWLLGSTLAVARIIYAWGIIETYGPSIKRATGFFATWFVYIIGAIACIYYGFQGVI
jgi:uncharacterized protein